MDLWFIGNGCEDHLTTADTNIPEDKRTQWKKTDALLCNILRQSIDAKTLYNIGAYKTCYTLWNQVKKLYTTDIQRLYQVISSIANLKQLGMDISSYGGRMSALKDELISILPKSTNTETSLSKMDRVFMIILLLNLGPDFENIREQILTGAVIPNFDEALARLHRHTSTATQSMRSKITPDTSVMVSQSLSRGDFRGRRGSNRGRGQRPQCTYCHRLRHTRDRCYQLHDRPPRTAHLAQSSDHSACSSSVSWSSSTLQGVILTPSEYEEYLRLTQAAKSSSIASAAKTGNVSVCLTHSSAPWILDTGAFDLISRNKDIVSSLTFQSPLPIITLANGSQTIAKGIGSVCPLPSLPLTSILYVPNFSFNLISISKLTRDLHCVLTFSHNSVTLQDRRTGKTIGIGHESQGLFHLSSPLWSTACTSTEAPLLLHSRLSHPSLSKFRKLVPHFSSLSSLKCESCPLGKHTRVLFPKRLDPRTKSPFQLVHTDVWGPSRSTSTLGFRYFVTFIDDYSRCTWLFLMKTRVELFSIFQKFHAEICTQFNTSIRILRSDNAKEYFCTSFSSFMSSHGILHQSSYAYTLQQNGVPECKNLHLVETTRTLLLHHKVPQHF